MRYHVLIRTVVSTVYNVIVVVLVIMMMTMTTMLLIAILLKKKMKLVVNMRNMYKMHVIITQMNVVNQSMHLL